MQNKLMYYIEIWFEDHTTMTLKHYKMFKKLAEENLEQLEG